MKTTLLLSLILSSSVSFGALETWTSKDGKAAELDLVSISVIAGETIGQFKTKAGATVSLKESQLSESDATRLKNWKSGGDAKSTGATTTASTTGKGAATTGPASVYDKILDKDLVKLSGKSLKRAEDATKPTKYYLFYYSASWCHPCHQFTPSVVEFYNKNKPNNDQFELVLITGDTDESAMAGYAKEMSMPWPMLNIKKAEKFKKDFNYGVDSIPRLVLTDLQGNVLGNGQGDVMQKLEGLLK